MKYQKGFVEDWFPILFILGILFFSGVAVSIGMYFDNMACKSRARGLGLESTWGPVQGCLVKVGSRYAPIEYIRITDDEKIIISGDGN